MMAHGAKINLIALFKRPMVWAVFALLVVNSAHATCTNSASTMDAVKCLEDEIAGLKEENQELKQRIGKASKWPHAINCGSGIDAIYILHGKTINDEGLAWYVQVYPNEYRYVRFNGNLSYHDRAGHNNSSVGCDSKSISRLRREGRTFDFLTR